MGKAKGRGRGRKSARGRKASSTAAGKKNAAAIEEEEELEQNLSAAEEDGENNAKDEPTVCDKLEEEEDDRSLLADTIEPPTFSPLGRTGPPEPLHQNKKLRWDHKVNLIGEKLINPMIHCCDKCTLPILTYGRMIPCKHVFCYDCAKKADKTCYRCNDKVQRLEQSNLGTVFMCTYGGSRQGKDSCRRTYLSQRDLQVTTCSPCQLCECYSEMDISLLCNVPNLLL